MKIEATRRDIRLLLELAQLDKSVEPIVPETQARTRDAAERRLPEALLTRYRFLAAAGRYPVIVAVDEQGTCSGCHVRLATMSEHQVKHSLGVYTCPRCRRMLYSPELLDERPANEGAEGKAVSRRRARQTSAHRS